MSARKDNSIWGKLIHPTLPLRYDTRHFAPYSAQVKYVHYDIYIINKTRFQQVIHDVVRHGPYDSINITVTLL